MVAGRDSAGRRASGTVAVTELGGGSAWRAVASSVGETSSCTSACLNSAAVWKRSAGRLASARLSNTSAHLGTLTLRTETGEGCSFSTLCMTFEKEPANGTSPVSSS